MATAVSMFAARCATVSPSNTSVPTHSSTRLHQPCMACTDAHDDEEVDGPIDDLNAPDSSAKNTNWKYEEKNKRKSCTIDRNHKEHICTGEVRKHFTYHGKT